MINVAKPKFAQVAAHIDDWIFTKPEVPTKLVSYTIHSHKHKGYESVSGFHKGNRV